MNQGKLVIVFIFGLSAVMGGYAWWHHYSQGRECVELWGSETGELIRYADKVELLRVAVGGSDAEANVSIGEVDYAIVAQRDITGTQGLVHARQALIEDASFLWKETPDASPTWNYVLRFTRGDKQVAVAIDCTEGNVRLVGSDKQAILNEHLTHGYADRLPDWLGEEASSTSTNQPESADMP